MSICGTDTKTTPKPDFRAIFCRAGVPPAIEQFTPAGGTPALHFKSPNESGLWYQRPSKPLEGGAPSPPTSAAQPPSHQLILSKNDFTETKVSFNNTFLCQ